MRAPGLRDNLKIIPSGAAIGGDGEGLIDTVDSTRGLVFVPAFTGLFTPHYRDDARGMIIGLTQFHTKAHIALAMLEAVCFQAREVLDAMQSDAGLVLRELRVVSRSGRPLDVPAKKTLTHLDFVVAAQDGGMCVNDRMMQIQADLLDVDVVRPQMVETTALGAAVAAGLAVGVWSGVDDARLASVTKAERTFRPGISEEERARRLRQWKRAVERSIGWAAEDDE